MFNGSSRKLWLYLEANLLEDLERENFSRFPAVAFSDPTRGKKEDYLWLRPCIHRNFAFRLAKYKSPTFVVEFQLEKDFLESFRLLPIDGMGRYAWTYWIHSDDREALNSNLKSKLKVVKSFSPR